MFRTIIIAASLVAAPLPAMAESTPFDVVNNHVIAYQNGNMSAFLATFADNAVLDYDGMRFTGKAEIRRAYSENFAPGAPMVEVTGSWVDGDRVGLEEVYIFSDGTRICCSSSVFTVRGGKIVSLTVSAPQ